MKLVLLPGMDGSGSLFAPLCERLDIPCIEVCYPGDQPLEYDALQQHVLKRIPDEPFVLLAESFSGPVGILVAGANPAHLRGLILCATFDRCPRLLYRLLRPFVDWAPTRLPLPLLSFALMGSKADADLGESLQSSLKSVSPSVLRSRLRSVLTIDVTSRLADIRVPCLYLRAARDRVVPSACGRSIRKAIPNCTLAEIEAPHFLLQCAPEAASSAIRDFVHTLPLADD